jgi:glycerophosphoryl diester phosphodiesterase
MWRSRLAVLASALLLACGGPEELGLPDEDPPPVVDPPPDPPPEPPPGEPPPECEELPMMTAIALAAALSTAAVPTTTSSVEYTCNGATTSFSVPFRFLESGHLVVKRIATATGAETTLTASTDYTVTGAGATSGTVTTTGSGSPCAIGNTLSIERSVPLTQPTSFRTQRDFSPATHENAFDRAAMGLQQLDRELTELRHENPTAVAVDASLLAANAAATASSYASAANGSSVAASNAQSNAIVARAAAETARDAALSAGRVYADTASGLGSSTEGQYFYVPTTNALILYRELSNTAVEQGRFATSAAVAPARTWAAEPTPWIIGHRGAANVAAPENSPAAFDYAASLGVAIETDVTISRDGVPMLIHDATPDRTTGLTTGLSNWMYCADDLKLLDIAQVYRPDLFSPQRMMTFEEYLRRYGATNLLIPEVKSGPGQDITGQPGYYTTAVAVANLIVKYRLQEAVSVQSFNQSDLLTVKGIDSTIRTVYTQSPQVPVSTATALGLWAVAVNFQNVTAQYVTDMHGAGVKVLVWPVNSVFDAERMLGFGVDGIMSDDPAKLQTFVNKRTPTGTTTAYVPAMLPGSGWASYSAAVNPKKTIVDGFFTLTYDSFAGANNSLLYVPLRADASPTTQVITTTLKVTASGADLTRFVGFRFAWTTDNDASYLGNSSTNGYYVAFRLNGGVEIVRVTGGSFSVIKTATWTAFGAGQAIPIRVDLTATDITVTRTDTGQTTSVIDATHPRGGFMSAMASGLIPAIGNTTLTY